MNLSKRINSTPWWNWVVTVDIFLIIYVGLFRYTPNFPGKYYFNIGYEMNFAAWWSGICLLTASLLSYECFCTRKKTQPKLPWLTISGLLLALSLDEIGSLHERIIFQGSWSNFIPYAVIGVILIAYSFITLLLDKKTRKSALLILLAFTLFGSVALQEYIEHAVDWPYWLIGIRVGVEEGTELLGIFLCLAAIIMHRQPQSHNNSFVAMVPNPFLMKYLPFIFLIGLSLHSIASVFVPGIDRLLATKGGVVGNPSAWYPASIFYVLFSACIHKSLATSGKKCRNWILIGIAFILFSLLICSRDFYNHFYYLYAAQLFLVTLFYLFKCEPILNKDIIILFSLSLLLSWFKEPLLLRLIFAGIFAYCNASIFLRKNMNLNEKISYKLIDFQSHSERRSVGAADLETQNIL